MASVWSSVPDEFRTCTARVSKAVVVVVSAVSMWSQKVRVALVCEEKMATCW